MSCPIVSLGNIVAGGTGKTPLTQLLSKELIQRKKKVAVLTRGYRSQAEHREVPLIACRGNGPLHQSMDMGDEAFLLSRAVPKLFILVGKNRIASAEKAKEMGADVILLDDGMQFRKLARNWEIVVINARDPLGKGYFLPRGYLRDSPARLKKADLIILNHVRNERHFEEVKELLNPFIRCPIAVVKPQLLGKFGELVGVFCGIGDPQSFVELLENVGATIVKTLFALDHELPSYNMLCRFVQACRNSGAKRILCTEKDWVKIPRNWNFELPISAVGMELQFVKGEEHWQNIVEKIANSGHNKPNL